MSDLFESLAFAAQAGTMVDREPRQSRFTWATVTQTSPLRIRPDGYAEELPLTPSNLAGGLFVGRRVWVQMYGRRVIVHGAVSLATSWVDCTVLPGFAARGDQYRPQVMRDADGMVHFRGHMSQQGLTGTGSTEVVQLPSGFWPSVEIRWIGFATNRFPDEIVGGWFSSTNGTLNIQTPNGPPSSHWSLIVQPWQAATQGA